jgi:hypothetical protein
MHKNMKVKMPVVIVLVVLVSSYVGYAYGKYARVAVKQIPPGAAYSVVAGPDGVARLGTKGTNTVAGTVISRNAESMVIKLQKGTTKDIFFDTTTAVLKSVSGKISDIPVDANVIVTGAPNSDESITAYSIQIRPAGLASTTQPR